MVIGVLTYDIPHRKTYDTLMMLKAFGYSEVKVVGTPLHYIKKKFPLIEHRPGPIIDVSPSKLCERLGYKYFLEQNLEDLFSKGDKLLIAGSGIINDEDIINFQIINSHPGYLPLARGLDAYKWSVYKGLPIGVTTHRLGLEIDGGLLIDRKEIFIKEVDTFHSIATKIYETEIKMLIEAIEKIDSANEYLNVKNTILHKRMPEELEKELFIKFEKLKYLNGEKRHGY